MRKTSKSGMTLRQDERQWLIYQETPVVAAVRGLEALCMHIAGQWLAQHPDVELRALGNVAQSLAQVRVRFGLGMMAGHEVPDELMAATGHVVAILGYLADGRDRPTVEESEMHAAAYWLDSTLRRAGVAGDGWFRELARGEG